MNFKHCLRKAFNATISLIPRKLLAGFLRSFESNPEIAERVGYHVYPRVFDSPFPLAEEIDWNRLEKRRQLPSIDFREPAALEMIVRLKPYAAELDAIPYKRPETDPNFWFENGSYTDFDAAALYAILRHNRPKNYVELGCGFSSYISSLALSKNIAEGHPCDAVYADPMPRRDMDKLLFTGELLRQRVQDLTSALFQKLEAGDVLFIDTSHVLKVQSDVVCELLEILPSLKTGVIIHIHDVFSPYDYPTDWVKKKIRLPCNEQYGVECLLSGGQNYRVLLPLYLLWREHRSELQKLFPRGQERPHGFWFIKN
jgi:ABC-type transporter Mla MlaB component